MARGGKRTGTPGKAYPQRQDLQPAGPLPPTAAPNQTYGAAGAQLASQRVIPMAPSPAPIAGPPPGPGPVQPGPGGPPPPLPAPPGHFGRPTERPNEPVTAGLPIGPGPGPSPAATMAQSQSTLTDLLSAMSNTPHASPEVRALAAQVAAGRR